MTNGTEGSLLSRVRALPAGRRRLAEHVLIVVAALVSAVLIFGLLYDVLDGALRKWTDRDLNRRAHLIGIAVEANAAALPAQALQATLSSLARNEDAAHLAVCSSSGALLASSGLGRSLGCNSAVARVARSSDGRSSRATVDRRQVMVTAHRLGTERMLLVVQDRTFLDARRAQLLKMTLIGAEFALLAFLLLTRAGVRMGSRRMEEAARSVVRRIGSKDVADEPVPPELRLFVRDVRATVEQMRHLESAQSTAESGVERLAALAATSLSDGGLVVVANREPYSHERTADGEIFVQRPASGLVTGIEPLLRSCGGTWIAYGGGSADRETADSFGRVAVPPAAPEYTLRRVWIGNDEYERYYSGFANEGLWPLCHVAHTQPMFRAADWRAYQEVNATFAHAAIEEAGSSGMLLIQDYHFALLPKLVREQAPHVVTSLFWHIPWPNSEVVGICPWKEALLEGMLGADVMGFHTRQYCLNFLEAAQRYLECRVDLDAMTVTYQGHSTQVRPYPISVEWPYPAAPRSEGLALRSALGIGSEVHVSVGVDRADYTKGLLERIDAIETLLEENPELRGRYVHVQLASPTRSSIRRYRQLAEDLLEAVERVNAKFARPGWIPVILQMRTFSPEEVRSYYAMADSVLVTPLHDGMNLVAKEYAAACEDGDGVLVLSVFAGAAKELEGALLVNPYDTAQVAQAILRAIRMPAGERKARMNTMREQIATNSIYDWSEKLLRDMCEVRQRGARFWPQRPRLTVRSREVAAV